MTPRMYCHHWFGVQIDKASRFCRRDNRVGGADQVKRWYARPRDGLVQRSMLRLEAHEAAGHDGEPQVFPHAGEQTHERSSLAESKYPVEAFERQGFKPGRRG